MSKCSVNVSKCSLNFSTRCLCVVDAISKIRLFRFNSNWAKTNGKTTTQEKKTKEISIRNSKTRNTLRIWRMIRQTSFLSFFFPNELISSTERTREQLSLKTEHKDSHSKNVSCNFLRILGNFSLMSHVFLSSCLSILDGIQHLPWPVVVV